MNLIKKKIVKKKILIAIDGFSSSGKSTLAKEISKKFGYKHIDTGSIYRIITLLAIRENVFNSDLWNIRNFIPFLKKIKLSFSWNKNKYDIYINGKKIQSKIIKSIDVSKKVPLISEIPEIRNELFSIQRNIVKKENFVIEGRDIGTHIFPESSLKLFINSSVEIRSYRRYIDFAKRKENISYDDVKKNLIYRDKIDSSRKMFPLKKNKNYLEIDNTFLNIKKQLNIVSKLIKKIK